MEYRARWRGINVIKVSERNLQSYAIDADGVESAPGASSNVMLNYSCNADYNRAVNIKAAMGYMRMSGAGLTQPPTQLDELGIP
ncbi:MAG: hypothetical protein QW797_03930 [Thermoproteota archaeon]